MNSKKAEVLLEKYFNGETDLQEELELKEFFDSKGSSHPDADYFNYLRDKKEVTLPDQDFDEKILTLINETPAKAKVRSISRSYWYVAASLALLISVSIIFKNRIIKESTPQPVMVQVDTFDDPEKAFEETKKALLFLSSKLNESSEYATKFSKFEQSQEVVKQN